MVKMENPEMQGEWVHPELEDLQALLETLARLASLETREHQAELLLAEMDFRVLKGKGAETEILAGMCVYFTRN